MTRLTKTIATVVFLTLLFTLSFSADPIDQQSIIGTWHANIGGVVDYITIALASDNSLTWKRSSVDPALNNGQSGTITGISNDSLYITYTSPIVGITTPRAAIWQINVDGNTMLVQESGEKIWAGLDSVELGK
jgi:hypothetical protein